MTLRHQLLMIWTALAACACTPQPSPMPPTPPPTGLTPIWVGTYTRTEGHVDGKAAGITQLWLDEKTGALSTGTAVAQLVNPSFVALAPNGHYLYAVSEIGPGVHPSEDTAHTHGYVYAYAVEADTLRELGRQPSYGHAPCHLAVHPSGQWLAVANYVGGVVALYPLAADGRLDAATQQLTLTGTGPHARQDNSHPHAGVWSPDGQWLMIPDLGADRLWVFGFDATRGNLRPHTTPALATAPGAGPRQLVFHPLLPRAYVLNELDNSVTALHWDAATGRFDTLQSLSTLPPDYTGENLAAHLSLTPDGRFLYASNRGHHSLAAFAVEASTGRLTALGHTSTQGEAPRHFTIMPNGRQLLAANQNSDNVVVFDLNPATGALQLLGQQATPTPVCLVVAAKH